MKSLKVYEKFIEKNHPKGLQIAEKHYAFADRVNADIKTLFEECGGQSIRQGLYHVYDADTSLRWSEIIGNYFEQYKGRIIPFGYDWAGRQYAMEIVKGDNILMFDAATAEQSALSQNIVSFHNYDLVDDIDSFFSENHFYQVLHAMGLTEIKYGSCIGHKVPLFLNGLDAVENYEVVNTEVYWEFQCQIYSQIKNLPPGTKINSIKFEP